ncbi:MAG: hypothetical protein FJ006_07165 [Chloroflexi bacterium]|nr:hypothetical protein [Chloroflexota bacterium]
MNKFTALFALLLALSALLETGCAPLPMAPLKPPSPLPPELPPSDTTSPDTAITSAPDETISYNKITFEWTGNDDKTPTADLTYSYYLEGYDADYSPFTTDISKTYTDLPDGSYIFYVKSRDEAGNIDLTPPSIKFTIATAPEEEKPEVVPPVVSTLLIVPNSDVSRIAVAYNNTIYALDSPNAKLYKSEHGGIGWIDISRGLGAAGPWTELAIAPDDPKFVAVVTNAGTEVYLSTDGGTSFTATGLAAKLGGSERVKCLAISPDYGRRDIAVGTSRGNGNGKVWVNVANGFTSGWQDMSTGTTGWSNADVFAIEYSPGFAADGTLLAIAATAPPTDDTYLYMGIRDLGGNTTTWNNSPGYPVEICQSGQDTPGTPLTYADLALPADYSGTIPAHRHVYACWSDNPPGVVSAGNPNDDVYRLDDTVCYRLLVRNDVICSLAHYGMYGRGKLLAGAATAKTTGLFRGPQVYCTFNPQSMYPTWQSSQKPPTGPGQARVAWSPDGGVAYCGTSSTGGGSHDQSAFSVSTNDGLTWNQIGLIDL